MSRSSVAPEACLLERPRRPQVPRAEAGGDPVGRRRPPPRAARPVRHQVPGHPDRRGGGGRPHPHRRGRHPEAGVRTVPAPAGGVVSPMQEGLPPIAPDAEAVLARAYTAAHQRCFPAPDRTPEADLAAMALASPYASYLEATGDGAFRWDLRSLAGFECHPGLVDWARRWTSSWSPGRATWPRCTSRPPSVSRSRLGRLGRRRAAGDVLADVAHVDGPPLQLAAPHRGAGVRGRHPEPPARRPSGAAPGVGPRVPHARRQQPGHRVIMSKGVSSSPSSA